MKARSRALLLPLTAALICATDGATKRAVSFDLGFIVREAKCSQQLIPAAKDYDDARRTYHMKDGSFASAAAHEGCCVLDRATGMMELLYSLQKCRHYKAGKPEVADPRLKSPLLPQARSSPCYAGALEELLREWPKCCHHHGRAAHTPGATRLWQRVTHGAAQLSTCMAVTRQLDERARTGGLTAVYDSCVSATNAQMQRGQPASAPQSRQGDSKTGGTPPECVRAAVAVVDIIETALQGAQKLYYGDENLLDPRDVTPSAHALLHLCDGVPRVSGATLRKMTAALRGGSRPSTDAAAATMEAAAPLVKGQAPLQVGCAARIEKFLMHNLGRKEYGQISSQGAMTTATIDTGVAQLKARTCKRETGISCAFFDCPTKTKAACTAPAPGHGGVMLSPGRHIFSGLATEQVELTASAAAHVNLDGGKSFTLGMWIRTSVGGPLLGHALPGRAATAWCPGSSVLAVWSDGLLHFSAFSKGGCNGDFEEPARSCADARSDTRVDDGAWHHVLVAYDAATEHVQLFVDGRPDGVSRHIPVLRRRAHEASEQGLVMKVGFASARFPPPPHFAGTIADVAAWPEVAMPAAAVWEEYVRGKGGAAHSTGVVGGPASTCTCAPGWCAVPAKGGGETLACEPVAAENKEAAEQLKRIASEKASKAEVLKAALARRYHAKLAALHPTRERLAKMASSDEAGPMPVLSDVQREQRRAAEAANKKMQVREALFKRQVAAGLLTAKCATGHKRVRLNGGLGWRCVIDEATVERRGKGKRLTKERHRAALLAAQNRGREAELQAVLFTDRRATKAQRARAQKELDELESGASDGSDDYEEHAREEIDAEHGIGGSDSPPSKPKPKWTGSAADFKEATRIAYMRAHMHTHTHI